MKDQHQKPSWLATLVDLAIANSKRMEADPEYRRKIQKLALVQHQADYVLCPNDMLSVTQALLSPSKPAPALERAFTRRSKLLRME